MRKDLLANLVDWIGSYGVLDLLAIGLVERFVPALPSQGVLVAIGIAVAGETWSLPAAFIVTTFGHICACMTLYMLVRALVLRLPAGFFGLSMLGRRLHRHGAGHGRHADGKERRCGPARRAF